MGISLGYGPPNIHPFHCPTVGKEPLFLIPVIPGLYRVLGCFRFIPDRFMAGTNNHRYSQFGQSPVSQRLKSHLSDRNITPP